MSNRKGLDYPEVIDLVADDPEENDVLLVIYQEAPWTGDAAQLQALQTKLDNYLRFALDGEMERIYPEFLSRRPRIRLYSRHRLDQAVTSFLGKVAPILEQHGVDFEVKPLDDVTEVS